MKHTKFYLLFFLLIVFEAKIFGQCFTVTPTSIGTVCPTSTHTVTPTISGHTYNNFCSSAPQEYTWSGPLTFSSTNTLATVITVGTVSAVATLQVTGLCPNIVCDPSFESGFFNSCDQRVAGDYGRSGCPLAEGNVEIVSLPSSCGFSSTCDFSAHSGSNMYIVNGNCTGGAGCTGALNDFYATNVSVTAGTWYYFSMWVRLIGISSVGARPNITVYIGAGTSTALASATIGPSGSCDPNWVKVEGCWYCPSSGTPLLHMRDANLTKIGNDFAIDDINMQPYAVQTYTVPITVVAPPTPAITYSLPSGCLVSAPPCPTTAITYTITGTATDYIEYKKKVPGGGYGASLYGYPPISFSMSGGGTAGDIGVKIERVTTAEGCEFPMSLEEVIPVAWPTATISAGLSCSGQPFELKIIGGPPMATVNVTPASIGTVVLDASGVYTVTPTITGSTVYCITSINNGCCIYSPGSPIACVTVNPAPVPTVSLNATPVCYGDPLVLNVTCPTCVDPFGYVWDGPGGIGTTTPVATTSYTVFAEFGTNVYSVTGTNVYSCSVTATRSVVTPPPPTLTTFTITPATTICHSTAATYYLNFTGTPSATVIYDVNGVLTQTVTLNFSGTASVVLTPTVTTTYTVLDIISTAGCHTIDGYPPRTLYIIPDPNTCVYFNSFCNPSWNTIKFISAPLAFVNFYVNTCTTSVSHLFTVQMDASGEYYLDAYISDGTADWPTSCSAIGTHLPLSSVSCYTSTPTLLIGIVTLESADVPSPDGSYCHFDADCYVAWKSPQHGNGGSVTSKFENIMLLPNPNNGSFTINGKISDEKVPKEINTEVTDVLGKTVLSIMTLTEDGWLNKNISLPPNIANGVYSVRLKGPDLNTVIKFVIDR
ncbi:MAG: Protein of unknown function precursor [Flavipsychrobacter sp.]|nr:Protein of unknown function precursor [Flavipsychrobacter sp.]